MNEKQHATVVVAFLCAVMLVFLAADLTNDDRLFSENENRLLASRPKFTKEAVLSGKYMKDYEKYVTDQFVSRDRWIGIKTRGDILMQKKDINGVYLGRDDYLIEQHLPEDVKEEKVQEKIELLGRLIKKYGGKVMLVPTADNVITDKLPDYARYYDQSILLDRVKKEVGERHFIDVLPILREHADEEIYYRTDHHWTSKGAYYGYLAWKEQAHKFSLQHYDTKRMETVTEDFLGTLHSRINLPVKKDSIQYFPETLKRKVTVKYDFLSKEHSLYEEKHLNGKNKYGFFLDDNHPFVEIETDHRNGKELFVLKDSYANCFVPLLTLHYEKIYMVDLRYYNGRLFDLMDEYMKPDSEVLVLYDCMHFIEDFRYY